MSTHHHHEHGCCGHDHHHDDHVPAACGHDHDHSACGHSHEKEHTCCGHTHTAAAAAPDDDSDAAWTHRTFMFIEMFVLLIIGGVLCYFVASGRIAGRADGGAPYVTGRFRALALAGGLGIMVLGVFNFLQRRRNAGCGHAHDEHDCCGHDHDHDHSHAPAAAPHSHDPSMGSRALVLLLISGSLAAGAILTPDGYSSKFMQTKGAAFDAAARDSGAIKVDAATAAAKQEAAAVGGLTLELIEKYQKRNADGNFELGVMQLYYTGSDPEYAKVMDGQQVETTGQMVKDEVNPGPGHVRLFTLQVTCCAADARPYSIPVIFEGKTPDYVEMGWYTVTGTLEFTQERGITVAQIRAKSLKAALRPAGQRTIF
jgi:uncharacterized repeat protein (TIGR03943 family)